MTTMQLLKEKRQERKRTLDQAGALLIAANKRATKTLTSHEEQEFDRRHAEADGLLKSIERLEKQADSERHLAEPAHDRRTAGREDAHVQNYRSRAGGGSGETRGMRFGDGVDRDDPHSVAFHRYLCGGVNALTQEERDLMANFQTSLTAEQRALSDVTGALGGYTVPQSFADTIDIAVKDFGGIIDAADYMDTDDGRLMPYPTVNDTANSGEITSEYGIVSGAAGGSSEVDMTFGVSNFGAYMFDSGMIKVPITLLQDNAVGLEKTLTDLMSVRLGRKLNTKCTVGSGTGEPMGIATVAPVGLTSVSGTGIGYNDLLGAEHSVDAAFRRRRGAGYMFNDNTLLAIKKLVDGNGRPLFIAGGVSEGIQNRSPDTLNGYPIYINTDLPNIAVNAVPVLFGDFKSYHIRRVGRPVIARLDQLYVSQLMVGFLVFQRFDGQLVFSTGASPVTSLKMNAS